MEKYKICPSCGTKNKPTFLECSECGIDLTNVKVTDDEKSNEVIEKDVEIQVSDELVRVCDCGHANPIQARKCSECGEDISDIEPSAIIKNPCFVLEAIGDDYKFKIKNCVKVGREEIMSEYLSKKPYVSRTHAEFCVDNDTLSVTNISETNFTYVNNEKILSGLPMKLNDGDEIGLGGIVKNGERQDHAAYFKVKILPCM